MDNTGKVIPPASKHQEVHGSTRRSLAAGPVSFALVLIALIFVMSVFFRIRVINVEGNEHYTDAEIIQAVDIEIGDNLFFFDRFAAVSRAFSKLPYVEEVAITRLLPGNVTITVSESKAMAYIVLGDENWTIDHGCKILGKATDIELPYLLPIMGIKPGTLLIGEIMETEDSDDELVAYLADVLYQISERDLAGRISSVDFSNKNVVRFNIDRRFEVVLGKSSRTEYKFGMVLSAIDQLKAGDTGTIDVSDGYTARFSPL